MRSTKSTVLEELKKHSDALMDACEKYYEDECGIGDEDLQLFSMYRCKNMKWEEWPELERHVEKSGVVVEVGTARLLLTMERKPGMEKAYLELCPIEDDERKTETTAGESRSIADIRMGDHKTVELEIPEFLAKKTDLKDPDPIAANYLMYEKLAKSGRGVEETKQLYIRLDLEILQYVNYGEKPVEIRISGVNGDCYSKILWLSLDAFLDCARARLDRFHLSEAGQKTIREFLTFKYRTLLTSERVPEGAGTYYNLMLYGEDLDQVNALADTLGEILKVLGQVDHLEERQGIIYGYNLNQKQKPCDLSEILNGEIFLLKNCRERKVRDEDAGTGKDREESQKMAAAYDAFWKAVATYAREYPSRTMIATAETCFYRAAIMADNDINHRIFGHRLEVPPFCVEDAISACLEKFRMGSVPLSEDFEEKFIKYVKAIYAQADLKGMEFAEDAVNRVYSIYFRMKDSKCLDGSCIPPYEDSVRTPEDVMAQLNRLVGLQNVKDQFYQIYREIVTDPENAKGNHHMMFYGNPGTGKTTVAKIAAELFCHAGLIRTNKCIVASAADLISPYKSGTMLKTRAKIEQALGGVLFVDEAYQLATGEYSGECVNQLLQSMLDYAGEFILIFAGYRDEMEGFLKSNPGLDSRIPHKIEFDDFTVEELKQIFYQKIKAQGFTLDPSAENVLEDCLRGRRMQEFFGNGRDVENLAKELHGEWAEEQFRLAKEYGDGRVPADKIYRAEHFKDVMPEKTGDGIASLIGLDTVKKQLEAFKKQVQYETMLRKMSISNLPVSYRHMVFMGNPGTGKTTVAKMIANDLYSMGVLKTNKLVVVERKDLVGNLSADASLKIVEYIKKARGGVLLIDEAYSLVDAGSQGVEIIEALLTALVDHREDMIFIFAGYSQEMYRFLEMNPGLPSRIGYTFHFEDYSTEQLVEMFRQKMEQTGLRVTPAVYSKVGDIFEYFRDMPGFANGRFVEQVISKVLEKRSQRSYDTKNYRNITVQDVPDFKSLIETNSNGLYLYDPSKVKEKDRLRTAYHESGHALAACILKLPMKMKNISIRNRAFSLGRVTFDLSETVNMTEQDLQNRIIMSLSGRAAEKVFFGDFDTGCSGDYKKAVQIAKDMIHKYGMGELGKTRYMDIIRQADEEAVHLMEEYRVFLEEIASSLISGKVLTGEEFEKQLKAYRKKKS